MHTQQVYMSASGIVIHFAVYVGSDLLYKKTPPVCRAKFKYSYL